MPKILCYTNYLPEGSEQYISFWELLLNENWANGTIVCPEEIYSEIGDLNTKLIAKRNYEFLLRASKKYKIKAIGSAAPLTPNSVPAPDNSQSISDFESFRTDCYIAGKYQKELLDTGYFNPVMETLLTTASLLPEPETAIALLEKMISHAPEYYEIDDNTRPILIYRGDATCYNQLNTFADELGKSLLSCHQWVEFFDVSQESPQDLTRYIGQHFKAILGIQTYLFSIMMQDKITNLHDLIIGPKFNMILDHPAWLKEHITSGPKDYYLLIHDRNYVNFANKYFKSIKGCFHFAPAGTLPPGLADNACPSPGGTGIPAADTDTSVKKKVYELSFIGTYYNYRQILNKVRSYDRRSRFLTARFLGEMKRHPNQPAESALHKIVTYYNLNLSDEEFLNLFFETRRACFCVMYYYREKIIRTLLDAGIEINVYGQSWNAAPFAAHPCLIRHPQLTPDEVLNVMQQSRISLNIMAWHKNGFTERIANSMLCHSVVLSDKSTALEEEFLNGEELLLFDLENLEVLPSKVKELLSNQKQLETIAQKGYEKAYLSHRWLQHGKRLLEILNNEIFLNE